MSSLKNIPVVTESRTPRSGEKYVTPQGFTAIKDGQKSRAEESPSARVGKPRWIMAPLATGAGFSAVKGIVREHRLATVCEEAKCPNIGECWNAGTATISVLDLAKIRKSGFGAVPAIGRIPVGNRPVALTFSANERFLMSTSQAMPPGTSC